MVLSVPFGYQRPQYRFLYFHPQTCITSVPEVESGCSEDQQQPQLSRETVRASADDTLDHLPADCLGDEGQVPSSQPISWYIISTAGMYWHSGPMITHWLGTWVMTSEKTL